MYRDAHNAGAGELTHSMLTIAILTLEILTMATLLWPCSIVQAATLCTGSRGDGKPAPILIIFGSGDSYDTSWTIGMPTCGVVDPSTGVSYYSDSCF